MTVKIHQNLNLTTQYGGYGLSSSEQSQEVSYTTATIEDFDNNTARAVFRVAIAGVNVDPFRFTFAYSGEGNVFEQAEPALKAFLEKQQEELAMQGNDPVDSEAEQPAENVATQEEATPETAPEATSEVLSK